MIAEAVDAALLLWRALWLWIICAAVAGTLLLLGMAAAVWAVCRMLRRAWGAMGSRTDSLGPLADEQPDEVPEATGEAERRSAPRWARDEHEHRRAA